MSGVEIYLRCKQMTGEMALVQTPIGETDEALAAAARAGDREAFTLLVARYREVAVAYAYACLRNREEAEDAAQEAFVRAFLALERFRITECWGAWLMRILRNHCTDMLRRRRNRPTGWENLDRVEDGATPEMVALSQERRRELHAAIAALPEKFRVPILMHYGSRRTYREIALALGIPETTVIGRMAGGMRQLRRRLGGEVSL